MQSTGNGDATAGASCREVRLKGDVSEPDSRRNLSAYGEFIVQRLDDDLSSYKNAGVHVPGLRERAIFGEVADRKISDMVSLRGEIPDMCQPSRSRLMRPVSVSSTRYWLDVNLNPIRNVTDAIRFAYLREYATLNLFDRLSRQAKIPTIEALFDAALWRQRETILWLDTAVIPLETQEWRWEKMHSHARQGVSRALVVA